MRRIIPITEQYQHFVEDLKGGFWGDVYGQVRRCCNEAMERESIRLREVYLNCSRYERTADRRDQRNGFYYRDFQTRFGCLRLKIARSRNRSFLPAVIQLFQRRSEDRRRVTSLPVAGGSPITSHAFISFRCNTCKTPHKC